MHRAIYRGDPGFSLGKILKKGFGALTKVGSFIAGGGPLAALGAAGAELGIGGAAGAVVKYAGRMPMMTGATAPTGPASGPHAHYVPGVGVVSQRGAHHVYGKTVGRGGGGAVNALPGHLLGAGAGMDGGGRAYRRMNVYNPKALRRANRRMAGFLKHAKKFLHYYSAPGAHKGKHLGFKRPKRRS